MADNLVGDKRTIVGLQVFGIGNRCHYLTASAVERPSGGPRRAPSATIAALFASSSGPSLLGCSGGSPSALSPLHSFLEDATGLESVV